MVIHSQTNVCIDFLANEGHNHERRFASIGSCD